MVFRDLPLPYDPELATVMKDLLAESPERVSLERLSEFRAASSEADVRTDVAQRGLRVRNFRIPGHAGGEICVSVIDREDKAVPSPCVYYVHGGGMIMGERWDGLASVIPWVEMFKMTVLTVEYRLAPEFPDPFPVEDCYAGLVWAEREAEMLGIDRSRIAIAGTSAGGGLAAGTALLARDRSGPTLAAQLLFCPMLDDRDITCSSTQYSETGGWDRESNRVGWSALLGDRHAAADVSPYAAPARCENLAGLPPAFIDCGSAEVFRDENVAYASALWRDGVQAELHVWAGGFHCFDTTVPDATISKGAIAARENWIARVLEVEGPMRSEK